MDAQPKALQSPEEKVWAALAHGSVLFFFLGPLIPAFIWSTQRKKSAYVAFHALQALGYQALSYWLWIALIPILMLGMVVVILLLTLIGGDAATDSPYFVLAFQAVLWGGMLGAFGLYFLFGLVGAGLCLAGRNFRYPLLGKWVERYVKYLPESQESLSEEAEDRIVAATGHAMAVVTMWGAIVPLIVWIMEKDRSRILRLQALQAAVYQMIGAATYFATMFLYMISIFGFMWWGITLEPSASTEVPPAGVMLFLLPMLCIVFVFLILWPLYLLLALWACIRVLRGHDFRYPILGRILERRFPAGESPKMEAAK